MRVKSALQNASESRGLVYAEVGKSSLKHQQNDQLSNFLDLDDSRVEYAQLNHEALTKRSVVQSNIVGTNWNKKNTVEYIDIKPP